MGKSVDLVTALLGIWRRGAVHVPLFTAFASPAIDMRLRGSQAKVVVVDADQREKVTDRGERLPIVAGAGAGRDGDLLLDDLLSQYGSGIAPETFAGDDAFIMIFTSGTTGAPKGVPTPVRGIGGMVSYLEYGFDLRDEDVYWNIADPGWAYGLFYAIAGPLATGQRSVLGRAAFAPELTWQIMSRLQVTNFAAAPTVYRALRNDPTPVPADLALRCLSSAGEPLNPDVIAWAEKTLGVPVRDHYGQTEVAMVIVNGWHPDIRRPLKPGAMGHPLPGWTVEVLRNDAYEIAPAGTLGRLAIDRDSPSMTFTGYHEAPERTAEQMSPDGRWYLTGDAASRDEEGYFYFSARDDDVIIMAGYRIGPFDVESVLVEHPDVAEAAVVGVPDELRGEVIEAFVALREGSPPSDELAEELKRHVKTGYSAHAYPRVVHFVDELPKTPSGKVQRFLLRERRRDDEREREREREREN